MVRIAICEDEREDAQKLSKYLRNYEVSHQLPLQIDCFQSGEEFLTTLGKRRYEIVFLDVYMGGITGLEVGREIFRSAEETSIVYITNSPEHAVDGFAVRAVHYLIKPIDEARLAEAMNRCQGRLARHMRSICVRVEHADMNVLLKDIIHLEVQDKKTTLYTHAGSVTTPTALDKLEEQLGGPPFLRCCRYAIANMEYVTKLLPEGFAMQGGAIIPIPRGSFSTVRQRYFDYLFAKSREEI